MSSVGILFIALLFFYWMRLIPQMAFYVKLITETVSDLKQFVIFFFLIITTFACSNSIIDQYLTSMNSEEPEPYENIMKEQTPYPITDAWINQWLLGLGYFYHLPMQYSDMKNMQWFYFVVATFFTQIIFLNMLIAIMGDTFNRLTDKKARNGLIQITALYSDFMCVDIKTN